MRNLAISSSSFFYSISLTALLLLNASFTPSQFVQMKVCQRLRCREWPGRRANQGRATTITQIPDSSQLP